MASPFDVIVIGAGMAGIYATYKFRSSGLNVVVLAKADEVGGTWYCNRYPGAQCDIDSLWYSYSFDEDLTNEWRWNRQFASQPEMMYLIHVVEKHDLRKCIHFGVQVVSAKWMSSDNLWLLADSKGKEYRGLHVVMATGCFSVPNPGTSLFQVQVHHTAEWPQDEVNLEMQSVAVIGTGSTGVQVIPKVAEQCRHLVVFQRSAPYAFPVKNEA